jgi:Family of unknown function (DUF6880)
VKTSDYKAWKARLVELGAETLAESIMRLACYDDRVYGMVRTLAASTPEESADIFRQQLKRAGEGEYLPHDRAGELALDLTTLLQSLRQSVKDPRTGLELLAEFYRSDATILERSDDSYGEISSIFTDDAQTLLTEYGVRCEDKEWLQDLLIELYAADEYGVRDELFTIAPEIFSESDLQDLLSKLQQKADLEQGKVSKRRWLRAIEALRNPE